MIEFITRLFDAVINAHPWHSPVVHFPIALFGAALLFLLLALWQRNEVFERAAFYNALLATLGTLAAGLTGYRDNQVRYEGEAQLADVKIFLAVTLFILAVITVTSRWRRSDIAWQPSSMILYCAAFVANFSLAAVLGFLGGVILYGF